MERGACWVWRSEVLASARVDDDLLGQLGEAEGGKEGQLEHLPFSNELTHCKPVLSQILLMREKERSKRRDRRAGGGRESCGAHREIQKKKRSRTMVQLWMKLAQGLFLEEQPFT